MCSGDYFFNCGGTGDLEVVCQNINWLYYIISNTKYKNFSKTYMPCKRKFYQGFLDTTRQLVDENHDQIELSPYFVALYSIVFGFFDSPPPKTLPVAITIDRYFSPSGSNFMILIIVVGSIVLLKHLSCSLIFTK